MRARAASGYIFSSQKFQCLNVRTIAFRKDVELVRFKVESSSQQSRSCNLKVMAATARLFSNHKKLLTILLLTAFRKILYCNYPNRQMGAVYLDDERSQRFGLIFLARPG